ncbi:MAG TPA: CoA transferase [Xanthobacteraceae bacterium]|jgi:crotonobetainyl-CoA:carnitine CoA-transferase CaiB-like acyl-CoA transferase
MSGPLSGIRVVDLTSVVFGPMTTQILGDMGADIIKVEGPEGDTTRYTGPARSSDMAALFMGINRTKRSLVLDIKKQRAKEALWRLIDNADIFVHSMRPQKIEALGFSHEAVLKRNPRIVYAGLHGYLNGGPYSGQPAYDDVIQGQSGIAALMAEVTGEPRYVPLIIADKTCAIAAVGAISAALFARERTGRGQFVEVPMFETMVYFVLAEHLYGHTFVPPEAPLGYTRLLAPWRRPYKTKDGHVCMLAYTDPQWRKFWHTVGKPELATDPRFVTLSSRSKNIAELYKIAAESLADRTSAEWLSIFQTLDIPSARISTLDEVFNDPHLNAVGMFKTVEHPTEGNVVVTQLPFRFSDAKALAKRMQPKFGEHTVEILREAGFSEADVQSLVSDGCAINRTTGSLPAKK